MGIVFFFFHYFKFTRRNLYLCFDLVIHHTSPLLALAGPNRALLPRVPLVDYFIVFPGDDG